MSFLSFCIIALSSVLIVEGLMYAFFTDSMRRMMMMALSLSPETLRNAGMASALLGALIISILLTITPPQ
jgi:uncharacterized protein YjeT (DUF2065 family)